MTQPDGTRLYNLIGPDGTKMMENMPEDVAIQECESKNEELFGEHLQKRAEEMQSEAQAARTAEAEKAWELLPAQEKTTTRNVIALLTMKPQPPDSNPPWINSKQNSQKHQESHPTDQGTVSQTTGNWRKWAKWIRDWRLT